MMNRLIQILKAPVRWLAELSPSCREASRLQSEALDHPLSFRRRLGLRIHVMLCKWCRRYGKQVSFLHKDVHEHPDDVTQCVPQKLSEEARERIKKRMQSVGE
jgi:hypothetical protein